MLQLDEERVSAAEMLMAAFADRTGLASDRPMRRYLWTDAFAVGNYVGLARRPGKGHYLAEALRVVDRVHHVLGRHRHDDSRSGWLSGLDEEEAERHPTRAGLRIGKRLPERQIGQAAEDPLEWERDGQYFHYLTRWMHALDLVAHATSDPTFNRWAAELAHVAHSRFVYGPRGGRRMFWKMSIDLTRPLVASMGQHDPLDGFLTFVELQHTASRFGSGTDHPDLSAAIRDVAGMISRRSLATADPLGIGGLLLDAARAAQLLSADFLGDGELLAALLSAAEQSLSFYVEQPDLRRPASERLAFRELGLAIGLGAIELVEHEIDSGRLPLCERSKFGDGFEALRRHAGLRAEIETLWLAPASRRTESWLAHEDINDVMLATALVPDGCVLLQA